jgi:mannose-6-phosphate isomerase-like protein (cupin superfamily)
MARPGQEIVNPAARMRLVFVRTSAETGGELLEVEATYDPGSVEPLEHFHPHQDERFAIVAGTMRARIGDVERELRPGERLEIPRGTRHAMWNGAADQARVRWQTRPAMRTEEFFETAFRLAEQGKIGEKGPRNPLLGASLMHRFRDEFRLASPPGPLQAVVLPPLAALARLLGQAG